MGAPEGTTTVVRLLLRYLEQEGVRHIFGIPGGPIISLYEALAERGAIAPVLAKHEGGAAFMADAYARMSRGIGVCCTTTGPGATNALTGLAVAQADHSPVLLLSAQVPTHQFGRGAFQESSPERSDIVAMFRPVTKWSTMVQHPDAAGGVIRQALRLMTTGRPGPVHVNLPCNFAAQPVPDAVLEARRFHPATRPFDRAAVQDAARLLLAARRPVVLAGYGADLSGAAGALRELCERFAIPVATTFKAKGLLPEDHPLSLGVFSDSGDPAVRDYVAGDASDALFVVGSSLGEASSAGWDPRLGRKAAFLHCDIDPSVIGRNFPVDAALAGDAAAVLRELRFAMEREAQRTGAARREPDPARPLPPALAPAEPFAQDPRGALHPRTVLAELRRALPRGAALFVDNGTMRSWAGRYFPALAEHGFFVNMGLASMGFAAAGAVGAQLAAPGRPVVALVGDAAFAMNGMEVHTAVEHGAPVLWVVVNNGGHGMIHHGERMLYGGRVSSSLFKRRLDAAGLARALGADAVRVERPGGLAPALDAARRRGVPCVLDVDTDMAPAPPMAARVGAIRREFAAA